MSANTRSMTTSVASGVATSILTMALDISGSNINSNPLPPVLKNINSIPTVTYQNLAAGDNAVGIPYGAAGVIAYPTSDTNAVTWGIKYPNAAATSMPQNVLGIWMATFPAAGGPTQFFINAGGAMLMAFVWF